MNIASILENLANDKLRYKPAHALMASMYYYDEDIEQATKYACLTVQMIDSIDPSDLTGPYRWIAENPEFCNAVYERVVRKHYGNDLSYGSLLHAYRSEQPAWMTAMSEAADARRAHEWIARM